MGLATLLARRAVHVAHVLVVESRGSARVRMQAERALTQRGWSLAHSPAEADVLFVCGTPGPRLAATIDRVWEQLPGPRARVAAPSPTAVEPALDEAARILGDDPEQRSRARDRRLGPPEPDDHRPMKQADDDGPTVEHDGVEHDGMDPGEMDHGDMEMAPGGIALADEAADHDGLTLDALTVPLGPVLAHWPAPQVLRCRLHGDLIVDADAEWLDADHEPAPAGDDRASSDDPTSQARWQAARYCDDAARLLSVAGWDAAADAARRHRNELLGSGPSTRCAGDIGRSADRISRSRSLRWALRGLTVPDSGGAEVELFTRPESWLQDAQRALGGDPKPRDLTPASPDALAERAVGLDIASARMVVAGCAPLLRTGDRDHV